MPAYSQRLNADAIGVDSYISTEQPASNFGGNTSLLQGYYESGKDNPHYYQCLLRWDLSAFVGYMANITNAVLTFTGSGSHTSLISYFLYRHTTPNLWTEFGVTNSNVPGYTTTGFSAGFGNPYSGGPYNVAFQDAALSALLNDALTLRGGYFDVRFYSSPQELDPNIMSFYASEHSTDSQRPLLTFDYDLAPPASSAMALTQSVSLEGSDLAYEKSGGSELRIHRRIRKGRGLNIWMPPDFNQ